ncbi:RTA1 like protein-domain-containing protein [Cladorrhinum sp. PSN259]|nr:RTA1 like protein-domain-containing protein [Cladorrhinum sp. PSN259]
MAGPDPLEGHGGNFYLWKYVPSLAAAVIFALFFLLATLLHIHRIIKASTPRPWFCVWFVIGGLMEVIGYIGRVISHNSTGKLMPYIIQNTFLLLPPVLFAATVYMVLGRIIIHANGESYSLIKVKYMTFTFVMGDVLSFCVQGGGAGIMVRGDGSNAAMGEKMIVGGLLIQIIVFGFFIVTAAVFHWRWYQQHGSVGGPVAAYRSGESEEGTTTEKWKKLMFMLYGVSALIMVRSLFRVAEFAMGQDGYLLANEWPLYVFDSVLMLGVMVAFYLWHPVLLQDGSGPGGRQRIRSGASLEESGNGTELKERDGKYLRSYGQ